MSDPRIKVSYLDAFPHNQDPKQTPATPLIYTLKCDNTLATVGGANFLCRWQGPVQKELWLSRFSHLVVDDKFARHYSETSF